MLAFLVGGSVATATYLYAKQKKSSTGRSATAAAVTGLASAGAWLLLAAIWPFLVVSAVVGGGFYLAKKKMPKALPPAAG
jgi:hypothetical protein